MIIMVRANMELFLNIAISQWSDVDMQSFVAQTTHSNADHILRVYIKQQDDIIDKYRDIRLWWIRIDVVVSVRAACINENKSKATIPFTRRSSRLLMHCKSSFVSASTHNWFYSHNTRFILLLLFFLSHHKHAHSIITRFLSLRFRAASHCWRERVLGIANEHRCCIWEQRIDRQIECRNKQQQLLI